MIDLSQNEIAGTTVKACRGVGVEWGLAHDAGYLAQYLAACDTPFLGSLLQVLEQIDGGDAPRLADAAVMRSIHAPVASLALLEWIAATGQPWQGEVAAPRYLFAALAIFTAENDLCFTVGTASEKYHAEKGVLRGAGEYASPLAVEITCHQHGAGGISDDEPVLPTPRPGVSVQVPEKCWQRLLDYAHRTYVPETEHSRTAGAGAGDIDNE